MRELIESKIKKYLIESLTETDFSGEYNDLNDFIVQR